MVSKKFQSLILFVYLQAVPMYLSEMAPAQHRGALNILFQFSTTLGIVVANLINYGTSKMSKEGWRVSLGLAGVPAIILIGGGLFCPESPNSLIEQDFKNIVSSNNGNRKTKRDLKKEGREVLQRIRGSNSNIDAEYEDIVEAANLANQVSFNIYTTVRCIVIVY